MFLARNTAWSIWFKDSRILSGEELHAELRVQHVLDPTAFRGDNGQGVVDLVSHPCSEFADRSQLGSVDELRLQGHPGLFGGLGATKQGGPWSARPR